MPDIQLNGTPMDIGWVQAIMAFPQDKGLRDQYFTVHSARLAITDTDKSDAVRMSTEDMHRIINARSYDEIKALHQSSFKRGIVAGDLLGAIYLMDRLNLPEPSINKAIHMVQEFSKTETYGDGKKMLVGEQAIKTIWSEYKTVGHLWAAYRMTQVFRMFPPQEIYEKKGFLILLELAAEIFRFATKFVPKRARPKEPIIVAEQSWRLPPEIKARRIEMSAAPIGFLELLESYKAPRPKPEDK